MSLTNKQVCSPIVLNFTSDARGSGSNSNFFSNPIDLGLNDYNTVCIVAASIPRSFYNVPSNYNTFIVQENLVNRIITLSPGSYNKTNLQSNLQTQLNSGSVPLGWSYTVSYPNSTEPQTFKYTITVSGNGGILPKFIFTNSMFHQLGFESNSTNNFTTNIITSITSLTSINVIDLSFISQVYIKSNMISNSNDGILQEILTYGSYPMGSFATFQQLDFEMNSRDLNKDSTNSWNFVLVDTFDREVDLNGIPWSFSLCLYCRNDTHEIMREDLRLKNEERMLKIQEEMTNLESKVGVESTSLGGTVDYDNIIFKYPTLPYGPSSSLSFLNTVDQEEKKVDEEEKKIEDENENKNKKKNKK
jgi:hypothetical protein